MMFVKAAVVCMALLATASLAADESFNTNLNANPIRKVVTLLQKMESTVSAEGEKEKELFDKYMCYCNSGTETLGKSIADAKTKIPQVTSAIASGEANLANLKSEVSQHQFDRNAAKAAMASATSLREKEAAACASEKAEDTANLAALKKATVAVEQGMGSAFLQSAAANSLKRMLSGSTVELADDNRDTLTAFLSEEQTDSDSYAPSSGQITGILKQMTDTMIADMKKKAEGEVTAIKSYEDLMAAKTKEVQANTDGIEKKTVRSGELGVEIVDMKEDLADTEESLTEDSKFLADLQSNCKTVGADYEARQKTRAEELLAIADTIKILNDDDALELFKKTLPGASLIQVSVRSAEMKKRALTIVQEARKRAHGHGKAPLDFIALALHGKSTNFPGIQKMIDDMIAVLSEEQGDDDNKKEYCMAKFDETEDKKKGLDRSVSGLTTTIDETTATIASTAEEIKALEDGVKALDKSVAEATEQRKEEHSDFEALMASDTAAQEILAFAKNRLNKFYNPKLYKAPPKRVLTDDERNTLAAGGTLAPTAGPGGIAGTGVTVFAQVSAHVQRKDAPAAPPPIGTYSPKGEQSNGVIGMIDSLVADMEKEMAEATTTEKDAQGDYEEMMSDSATKRAEDLKSIANKSGMKAELEEDLANTKAEHMATMKELMATEQYMAQLHGECDWLIQNFDLRKEARDEEVESMKKAKAVLSGADYSLLQKSHRLRGH